jgi:hypothetical protein
MSAYLGPVFWLVVYVAYLQIIAPMLGFNRLSDDYDDEDEDIADWGIGSGSLPDDVNPEIRNA